jgi:hypothetical protein
LLALLFIFVLFQKAEMSEEKNLSSLHDQLQQEAAKLVR